MIVPNYEICFFSPLGRIRNCFLLAWYKWYNTSMSGWGGCSVRRNSLPGEPSMWPGCPCSSLAAQVERVMESTAEQCALCVIQIVCLTWFKPHFYTRENDWPQFIWEMEVCSGKVNKGRSEAHVLADSVAADVFSISVSKRETSSWCANGRDICHQCQYFVNYFTILLVLCLFSLPLSLCVNKYFRYSLKNLNVLCRYTMNV